MKTWAMMHLLIWVMFLDMLIVLFPALSYLDNLDVHMAVGIVVVALAFLVFRNVRRSPCPVRIKSITGATLYLSVFDGLLGLVLYLGAQSVFTVPLHEVVVFLHFGLAIAIITHASASAAAYDMWEEGEFAPPPAASVGSHK